MWFSHINSVILQLYYLVSGQKERYCRIGHGLFFFFLPPQPRNDTLSVKAHWTGSITWPLPLGKGDKYSHLCAQKGRILWYHRTLVVSTTVNFL